MVRQFKISVNYPLDADPGHLIQTLTTYSISLAGSRICSFSVLGSNLVYWHTSIVVISCFLRSCCQHYEVLLVHQTSPRMHWHHLRCLTQLGWCPASVVKPFSSGRNCYLHCYSLQTTHCCEFWTYFQSNSISFRVLVSLPSNQGC